MFIVNLFVVFYSFWGYTIVQCILHFIQKFDVSFCHTSNYISCSHTMHYVSTVQEVPESTSLEEAGITVTRTTSVANLEDHERTEGRRVPQQTDHLSQSYSHSPQTPTPPKATSPLPPHTARPHSVADFRHRRYRRTSSESNRTQ